MKRGSDAEMERCRDAEMEDGGCRDGEMKRGTDEKRDR